MRSTKLFRSFKNAFNGIFHLVKRERNAKIHLVATIAVLCLAYYLKLDRIEWLFIILMIGLVFTAEAFNTAIEILADKVEPKIDPQIKLTKDIAAAGVLIITIIAIITAFLIFIPKFFYN